MSRCWVLLALILWSPSTAVAQDVRDVFRRVNASVVIVHATWQEQAITTSHVVQTADNVVVEFLDGEKIQAAVVASEPEADVSLLQLAHPPAQPVVAQLGDSEQAQVGIPCSWSARPTASATRSPSGT